PTEISPLSLHDALPIFDEARRAAAAAGRDLAVVASVCGTDADPQNRSRQVARLEGAGVLVEESNARAAALAGAVLTGDAALGSRSEEHTSELQSPCNLV